MNNYKQANVTTIMAVLNDAYNIAKFQVAQQEWKQIHQAPCAETLIKKLVIKICFPVGKSYILCTCESHTVVFMC